MIWSWNVLKLICTFQAEDLHVKCVECGAVRCAAKTRHASFGVAPSMRMSEFSKKTNKVVDGWSTMVDASMPACEHAIT